VKSIRYGNDEILGSPFKHSESQAREFEVVLRSGAATVRGVVNDDGSQPVPGTLVVLVPRQRDRTDLFAFGTTGPDGRFSIANVAPGDYRVYSWEDANANAPMDPEFMKLYDEQGTVVRVDEFSEPVVTVRLIP
jgi:hypothetical protein